MSHYSPETLRHILQKHVFYDISRCNAKRGIARLDSANPSFGMTLAITPISYRQCDTKRRIGGPLLQIYLLV